MSNSDVELFHAIKRRDWAVVRNILLQEDIESKLLFANENGENSIHTVCFPGIDAPLDVFRSLLFSSSSSKALIAQNRYGRTPLHKSVYNCTDELVLMVLEACPFAATIPDDIGWTAFHHAMRFHKSLVVLRNLLIAHPAAVLLPTVAGKTPLQMFFRGSKSGLTKALALKENRCELMELEVKDRDGGPIQVRYIYQITILLLKAAVVFDEAPVAEADHQRLSFLPLHASIALQYCPSSFIALLLLILPDQASQTDANNDLPLHIAAQTKGQYITPIIQLLLKTHPRAASTHNHQKRLPLHLAIQAGEFREEAIQSLYHAAPRAIETRDVHTHLFAFMMAAAVTFDPSPEDEKPWLGPDTDTRQVSTVYFLLREYPDCVRWGIPMMV